VTGYRPGVTDDFPLLSARTRRFSLGVPRDLGISPDGACIVFLRSRSGTDPVTCLWAIDVASGQERLLVDPATLGVDEDDVPAEERARRERAREQAGGVVRWVADEALATIAFTLGGSLWVLDVAAATCRSLPTPVGVIDARLAPDGRRIGYVVADGVRVHDLVTGEDRQLAAPDGPGVTLGIAEFAAAEEMDRERGFWWAPDGSAILVQRTDESGVAAWHIGDPADPAGEPAVIRYPAAGTPNARVSLRLLRLDGASLEVPVEDEYLAEVTWDAAALVITTMPRDQRALRFRRVDPATGRTELVGELTDRAWVDVQPGMPRHLPDGSLVRLGIEDGARRLVIGQRAVTPVSLEVSDVLSVDGERILLHVTGDPSSRAVVVYDHGDGSLARLSPDAPGVWTGRLRGGTLVLAGATVERTGIHVRYAGPAGEGEIRSLAEDPGLLPRPLLRRVGSRSLPAAVLFPADHVPGSRRLPVLLDPYGGPGHARVLASLGGYLMPQWFADQGFVVIIADGRGTPGRGPAWEREVLGDLAGPALEDQVHALEAVAAAYPDDLDLGRVAIRGWSFGGFLALLAILRRPDTFHAAIAGAPVTDWRLYDTCYTERFLGHPDAHPEAYARSSVITDAPSLRGRLMLIHGLADDNVVPANGLRMSSALLAAGRPHEFLPLTGATHMGGSSEATANLIHLELDFLRRALGT
jgi:dipeptidyl-peptidase-4